VSPRIQDALSELLAALGFERMATDVKTEDDLARLRTYARIIVKNSPPTAQREIANRFRLLRPALY